jgi:hypothetical protein
VVAQALMLTIKARKSKTTKDLMTLIELHLLYIMYEGDSFFPRSLSMFSYNKPNVFCPHFNLSTEGAEKHIAFQMQPKICFRAMVGTGMGAGQNGRRCDV